MRFSPAAVFIPQLPIRYRRYTTLIELLVLLLGSILLVCVSTRGIEI